MILRTMAALERVPGKVVALHSSYRSRAAERGAMPPWPSYFLKPASSLAASGDPVARPPGCELLAFEGEVALVIGRRARRVRPADGWDHVAYLTAANDFGVYDLRYADRGSNVRSKGIDGFTPLGPRLIDAREHRPGSAAPAHLGQRRTGPGRLARAGHAVRLRRHRRRPVPAPHAGPRRRDPHRHPHRLDRGDPRRRGGGRGQRRGPVVRPAAQPGRRGGLPPGPARRHAPRRRRRTRRRLWLRAQRHRQRAPPAPDQTKSSMACARSPPPPCPPCCASAA